MRKQCICGAARWTASAIELYHCGSHRQRDGSMSISTECRNRQLENLAEFRRGVESSMHATATGALTVDGLVAEITALMAALPGAD